MKKIIYITLLSTISIASFAKASEPSVENVLSFPSGTVKVSAVDSPASTATVDSDPRPPRHRRTATMAEVSAQDVAAPSLPAYVSSLAHAHLEPRPRMGFARSHMSMDHRIGALEELVTALRNEILHLSRGLPASYRKSDVRLPELGKRDAETQTEDVDSFPREHASLNKMRERILEMQYQEFYDRRSEIYNNPDFKKIVGIMLNKELSSYLRDMNLVMGKRE